MKVHTITKPVQVLSKKEESVFLPWADLQRGLEDIKSGRIRLWKPRHLRNQS